MSRDHPSMFHFPRRKAARFPQRACDESALSLLAETNDMQGCLPHAQGPEKGLATGNGAVNPKGWERG